MAFSIFRNGLKLAKNMQKMSFLKNALEQAKTEQVKNATAVS